MYIPDNQEIKHHKSPGKFSHDFNLENFLNNCRQIFLVFCYYKVKCRILGLKPSRVTTVYFSRRVTAIRLVLLATLYIYVDYHQYMYCINYFE